MKIYCAHSSGFDYQHEWYDVLRQSHLSQKYQFILPHESEETRKNSRPTIESCDCFIAEVSYPSTGLGIEMGWASVGEKQIYRFYRAGSQVSHSLSAITSHILPYSSSEELISLLTKIITGNEQ